LTKATVDGRKRPSQNLLSCLSCFSWFRNNPQSAFRNRLAFSLSHVLTFPHAYIPTFLSLFLLFKDFPSIFSQVRRINRHAIWIIEARNFIHIFAYKNRISAPKTAKKHPFLFCVSYRFHLQKMHIELHKMHMVFKIQRFRCRKLSRVVTTKYPIYLPILNVRTCWMDNPR
jgi:hypothetical protein